MVIVNRNTLRTTALLALAMLACGSRLPAQDAAARPPAPTLTAATGPARPVDERGFIRRWLVLEPVPVRGQLTEPAVQEFLQSAALPDPPGVLPRTEPLVLRDTAVRWHALDTSLYNFNLYHFAWALSKPTSNVLFWVAAVVDSPIEIQNARLAICSNAASNWWLNGEPVIALYDDRQSVIDDGVSKRLTLRKGRNVIRGAVVNAGGATDFCARFLDADDRPVTGLQVTLQAGAGGR